MTKSTRRFGFALIDCGSAKKATRGLPIGFFYEQAPAPFNLTIFGPI